MTNPYEGTMAGPPADGLRPYVESKTNLARWSWKLPLFGLVISIFINACARPFGIVGGFLFIGSVVVGFILSTIGIVFSFSYSRVARHAVIGLAVNAFLALSIVGMFIAIEAARDAAIKARESRGRDTSTENVNDPRPES